MSNRINGIRPALIAAVTLLLLSAHAWAYSPQMRKAMIGPPWELALQMGHGGSPIQFPLEIDDFEKVTQLDQTLPLIGSPLKVRLEKYLPALTWETSVVQGQGTSVVAKLTAKGPNLDQTLWLDSDDPLKRTINSSIGGIMLRRVYDKKVLDDLIAGLKKESTLGIVSVWKPDQKTPLQFVIEKGLSVDVPGTGVTLNVIEYVPHYTIDRDTKKVTSQSEKPVNPALRVELNIDGKKHEKWLWSKFPASPHEKVQLPVRMEFADFDVAKLQAGYVLAVLPGTEPVIVFSKENKRYVEKARMNQPYPFSKEGFYFTIEELHNDAALRKDWKNQADELLNPAIVATVDDGKAQQQYIMELNKPAHHKSESDTLVMLYRRKAQAMAPAGMHQSN